MERLKEASTRKNVKPKGWKAEPERAKHESCIWEKEKKDRTVDPYWQTTKRLEDIRRNGI